MSLVWINGQLVDKSEARISVFDHGFLYGDGAWTHMRAFGGKLFRPEQTIQFFHSCSLLQLLGMECPFSEQQLLSAIESTLEANRRTEGYIRLIATRGSGTLGPDPRKCEPQVIIIVEEYHPFPRELYEHGLSAEMSSGYDPDKPEHYELLGGFFLVRAKQRALAAGCLEAVLFWKDEVVRATEGNLFLVRNQTIYPVDRGGYDVMIDVVPELADDLGIPIERRFDELLRVRSTYSLLASDEVFIGGITGGVIAIISVDNKPIGTGTEGPITKRIREAYRKLTRGEA